MEKLKQKPPVEHPKPIVKPFTDLPVRRIPECQKKHIKRDGKK